MPYSLFSIKAYLLLFLLNFFSKVPPALICFHNPTLCMSNLLNLLGSHLSSIIRPFNDVSQNLWTPEKVFGPLSADEKKIDHRLISNLHTNFLRSYITAYSFFWSRIVQI